jgi:hypothetical protein
MVGLLSRHCQRLPGGKRKISHVSILAQVDLTKK